MAIEVIKRGKPPNSKVYNITCKNCKSELKCRRSDGQFIADQRDGDVLLIVCPVCYKDIYVKW